MLKIILGLGALYAIAFSVSTPESRAAAAGPVDRFGKRLFVAVYGLLAVIVFYSYLGPPDPPDDESAGLHGPP